MVKKEMAHGSGTLKRLTSFVFQVMGSDRLVVQTVTRKGEVEWN